MGSGASRQQETVEREGSGLSLPLPQAAAASAQASPAIGQVPYPITERVVNYKLLPPPVKYEELQREAYVALKPDLFEGFRFDITKPLNQNFGIQHSIFMGNQEVTGQGHQVVKVPHANYEFGANLISHQGNFMIGRIQHDGRMVGRAKCDLNDMFTVKAHLSLSDPEVSQGMVDIDAKGSDWNAQLKLGNTSFYGLNYLQSVTPTLAVGGEMFWLGKQRKSGVGFAARHATDKSTATCQIATTGLASLTYLHRITDKMALGTDLTWNWNVREATASIGYDYNVRTNRLRARIDTDGKAGAYLEEKINNMVMFLLSAEIDYARKDYKFGFGLVLGE